jgi:GMP synthase-like glutamine amidotransferase
VRYTRFYEDPALPDLAGLDLVIAMGGPMSVNDEAAFPWLVAEKAFIREAVGSGKAVLGVCLGAQLIASALGARVYPAARKEIGWLPIETAPVPGDIFRLPDGIRVFQWHGETFDLPEGAVRLARSGVAKNQGFQLHGNVLGLQFHLETTPESARALVDNCGSELVPGPSIQAAREILEAPAAYYEAANRLMNDALSFATGVLECGTAS